MTRRDRRVEARERYLGDGSGRLFVREVGQGMPLVVLHGGPDFDHEYLLPEMDRLADLRRVVYYAQRGRGRSFAGQDPSDVTLMTELDDLDRVRGEVGGGSVAVLGHSWGGLIAAEYAIRQRERVSHLILMNTAPVSHAGRVALRAHLASLRSNDQIERLSELRSSPRYLSGDVDTDLAFYRVHFASAVARPDLLDRLLPRLRANFDEASVVAARAIEERLYAETWDDYNYNLLPALADLEIPTLLIHGDHDLVPLDVARDIAGALPMSKLVVLEDCGHFAYLEQPERVHAHVSQVLTGG